MPDLRKAKRRAASLVRRFVQSPGMTSLPSIDPEQPSERPDKHSKKRFFFKKTNLRT